MPEYEQEYDEDQTPGYGYDDQDEQQLDEHAADLGYQHDDQEEEDNDEEEDDEAIEFDHRNL